MNKVVFLDRDGTINIDYGYVHEVHKLVFFPGVLESLRTIQKAGYMLIIITNQSGIGRGYFTKEEYNEFSKIMLNKMTDAGVIIEKIYTCPHKPEENCKCRKPLLGLFDQAICDYDIDISSSYVIGDRLRDLSICEKYPVKGILFSPENGTKTMDERELKYQNIGNCIVLKTWRNIAKYICEE